MIKENLSKLTIYVVALMMSLTIMSATSEKFTASEQQQISVPTPGLFAKSNIINIDFTQLPDKEYSFPLPVGKAILKGNNLEIETKKGDAVKAMFDGTVRLSLLLLICVPRRSML